NGRRRTPRSTHHDGRRAHFLWTSLTRYISWESRRACTPERTDEDGCGDIATSGPGPSSDLGGIGPSGDAVATPRAPVPPSTRGVSSRACFASAVLLSLGHGGGTERRPRLPRGGG